MYIFINYHNVAFCHYHYCHSIKQHNIIMLLPLTLKFHNIETICVILMEIRSEPWCSDFFLAGWDVEV